MKLNISNVALIIVVRQLLGDLGDDNNKSKPTKSDAMVPTLFCFKKKKKCGLNLQFCQLKSHPQHNYTSACDVEVGVCSLCFLCE